MASVRSAVLGAVSCLLFAAHAEAQAIVPLDTQIEASIVSICPSPTAVSVRLDAYLAESTVDADVSATLRVQPHPSSGFTAEIGLRRGALASERTIVGASCAEVLEAAVLVMAIAIDPDVLDRAPPETALLVSPPDGAPSDGAAPDGAPPDGELIVDSEPSPREALSDPTPLLGAERLGSPTGHRAPQDARIEPTFILSAHAAMTVAVVPQPSFGAFVDVGVRLSWLELTLGFLWGSEIMSQLAPGRGGTFGLYVGTLRIGAALRWDVLEIVPQARLGVGAMTARGVGVARPRFEASEWFDVAVGLEVRVRFALGPLDLALSVLGELSVPFVRPRFVLNTDEDVFTPEVVGATFGLGLVSFWGSGR